MKFRQYGDGKWRCVTDKALFTSRENPAEAGLGANDWEDSGFKTETGLPVFVPKSREVELDYDEVNVAKAKAVDTQKVTVNMV